MKLFIKYTHKVFIYSIYKYISFAGSTIKIVYVYNTDEDCILEF